MVVPKNLLLLILLLCLPGFLPAQQIISTSSQKIDYRIPYRKADGKNHDPGNLIMREMAKDVLREPWLVKIIFLCNLRLSVVKTPGLTQLQIFLDHPAIAGDTVYRRFPIADMLFPSVINLKIRLANRADTSGYVELTLAGKQLPPADSLIGMLPLASYDPMVDTLLIRDVELFYDSADLETFSGRIELIHDYYASVAMLDSLQQFTSGLQLDNTKQFPVNYLKIEELSSILAQIDARDFPAKLLRNGFDPMGFMVKYRRMYTLSRTLVYNFMDEVRKVGTIPWNGDIDGLADYFTSRVFSYVRRSFLMDQQQGEIYHDCLDHLFDKSTFPREENIPEVMLSKMFPDAGQDSIARFVSQRIYASYSAKAGQLINQNQHAGAFAMMENARVFVSAIPALKGFADDTSLQSQAAEGIYNSYIGIASTCISNHKYDMAENYLSKANQYAASHEGYIRSDSMYRAVFSELFFLRNVDCDQLLDMEKYAEALDCYQQFERNYSAHDLAMIGTQLDRKKSIARVGLGNLSATRSEDALKRKDTDTALFYYEKATALIQKAEIQQTVDDRLDSLAPVMAGIKYGLIVGEGAAALEKRQFTRAVNLLHDAKSLAEQNGLSRSREFDSLYRQAMKNFLIVQLSSWQKKIWANQFDSAQWAIQHTESVGFDFGLLEEPDFLYALNNYRIRIREQKCRNLQDSVELRLIRADRNAAMKSYLNVTRYYQEALIIAASDTSCKINKILLNDSLIRYQAPSRFQRNEQMMNAMVSVGDYNETIQLFVENIALHEAGKLWRFGLGKPDMYEFVTNKNNPYLTEATANFLLKNGQSREAFRFLLLLNDQNVAARLVQPLQREIATALAREDLAAHPEENQAEALLKYPVATEWFEVFRKIYSQERER